jgi:hypothetical protein
MNFKEMAPHPTGGFPSVEEEIQLRYSFLDKNNPVLKRIRVRLENFVSKGNGISPSISSPSIMASISTITSATTPSFRKTVNLPSSSSEIQAFRFVWEF